MLYDNLVMDLIIL